MPIGQWFRSICIACAAVLVASCTVKQPPDLPRRQLPISPASYGTVLRFPDDSTHLALGALRYYSVDEGELHEVPFVEDNRCRATDYTYPTALPDGRLGLHLSCKGRWPDRPIGRDNARYIVAYDWETGELEQIVDEPLPFEARDFSWSPDMTRGVLEIGSLLSTIVWLTPVGMEPMTITIGSGEQSWSLEENLAAMYDDRIDNSEVGIARDPVWSPDGRFIAFWASTNVIGRSGISRARGTYSLYLLDPDTLQLQEIAEGVKNTGSPAWSPDSRWILFTGNIGSVQNSMWLVSADGDTIEFVGQGRDSELRGGFAGWDWLNDQDVIATICQDDDCEQADVVLYDVSEVIGD